jgi:murein DD-endopeptidase MepM/ murein hydrolase activator NlpD
MKKTYIILFLVLSLFVISSCSIIDNVTEIELINLNTGENTIIPGDSEHAEIIQKAIKSINKTSDNLSDLTSYEVLLKKNSQTDNYKLSFDLNSKKVFVTQEGNNYVVDENISKELLLNENFAYVYIDSTLYDSFLDLNENKINPDVKYDWTFRDIEGNYITKQGNLNGSVSNDGIKISEDDILNIAYEKSPDSQVVRAYSQEKLVSSGTSMQEVLNNLTQNGEYLVESQAQWLLKDGTDFYGTETLTFNINIERKANVEIVTRENYPGNIMLVSVNNLTGNEKLKLNTDAVKTQTETYNYKEKNVFICPIDLNTKPGAYDLNVVVNEGTSDEYTITTSFEVKSKTFKTQYLTVDEQMNETNNDNAAIYEFAQLVKPARTESVDEKLWEGTFDMPVNGELTTDFAEIRYVNNEQSSSRHSGLDLSVPLGTEVKAPNNGIVTFAMEGLLSPGNTVVIDHGMGLFTSYYHLNSIAVKKGQNVKKGEVIGTVGTTGFSTGPHLHYAVSIYNTYVNPYQTLSGIID